jgi:hypothetical protein
VGAWGSGPFENDSARDWLWDLQEATDAQPVHRALAAPWQEGIHELLAPEAEEQAIAAAAVVGAAHSGIDAHLPAEAREWLANHSTVLTGELLRKQALSTLERLRASSEVGELWRESNTGADWLAALLVTMLSLGAGGTDAALARQLAAAEPAWRAFQAAGVADGSRLRFDFEYSAPSGASAHELERVLAGVRGYAAHSARRRRLPGRGAWTVEGKTAEIAVDPGALARWIIWMVAAGEMHGGCTLTDWGAPTV